MKRPIKSIITEVLIELAVTALFFGLGILIMKSLGMKTDIEKMDFDLITLIGVAVFLILFVIIYVPVHLFKKKTNQNNDNNKETEDNEQK